MTQLARSNILKSGECQLEKWSNRHSDRMIHIMVWSDSTAWRTTKASSCENLQGRSVDIQLSAFGRSHSNPATWVAWRPEGCQELQSLVMGTPSAAERSMLAATGSNRTQPADAGASAGKTRGGAWTGALPPTDRKRIRTTDRPAGLLAWVWNGRLPTSFKRLLAKPRTDRPRLDWRALSTAGESLQKPNWKGYDYSANAGTSEKRKYRATPNSLDHWNNRSQRLAARKPMMLMRNQRCTNHSEKLLKKG